MNKSSIEIFPTTIFKVNLSGNNTLKEELSPKIIQNSSLLTIPEDWGTGSVKTSFEGEPEGFEILQKGSTYRELLVREYNTALEKIFDKEFNFSIKNIWYNYYNDGEYQEDHDHLGNPFHQSHFSLIHFLSYNKEEHTPPEFRDPLSQLRCLSLELDSNRCGEVYVPNVEEGDLLMFPSYLVHRVLPCKKTNYPRITISFNIVITKYGEEEL